MSLAISARASTFAHKYDFVDHVLYFSIATATLEQKKRSPARYYWEKEMRDH